MSEEGTSPPMQVVAPSSPLPIVPHKLMKARAGSEEAQQAAEILAPPPPAPEPEPEPEPEPAPEEPPPAEPAQEA